MAPAAAEPLPRAPPPAQTPVLAYKSAAGELRVAPNRCAHMDATFASDVEDAAAVKCSMHGAKLDLSTMKYATGPAFLAGLGKKIQPGTAQPCFVVTMNADGSASLTATEEMGKGGGGCEVA